MEIMASLPSVVLGFLAALWLAPLIESRVPSILLVCLGVPSAAAGPRVALGTPARPPAQPAAGRDTNGSC